MAFELDHLFVFTPPDAPVADRITAAGFTEGPPNTHPGQGTACRRFFFDNVMLELLWVTDEAEARSPSIRRTGLWKRSCWAESDAAPLGICLRGATETRPAPFATWDYRPPYLPSGMAILNATSSLVVAEPLLFMTPAFPRGNRELPAYANGVQEVSAVEVSLTHQGPYSEEFRAVVDAGLVSVVHGERPCLDVTFDRGRVGEVLDLQGEIALVLRW
jgi:hypothetical protein